MKEKSYEMTMLFDFYGDILTDKQRELFDLYYNEDLSLAEISEHLGITRQGVRDGIVRAEEIIKGFEEKLGLVSRFGRISEDVDIICKCAERIAEINGANYKNPELYECAVKIISRAKELAE